MKKMIKTLLVAGVISLTACAPNTVQKIKDPQWSEAVHYEQYIVHHNIKEVYQRYLSLLDEYHVFFIKPKVPQNFYGETATITVDAGSAIMVHFEMTALGEDETVVDAWDYIGGQKKCPAPWNYNIQCFKEVLK